ERVENESYTVRICAEQARTVRIAVDQGEWRDCRPAVGFWWFDWAPEASGEHELIACAEYESGQEAVSGLVHCVKS
ncbi:MAG: hypothetical protein KGK30_00995, partial [Elusimicrobia bacterium]|nr:hypothetical protein [Elusimicrobiota bacterium]